MWQARVPDGGEGGVRLQEVGDDLSTLHFQVVAAQPANKKGVGLSMAADSCKIEQVYGGQGMWWAYLSVWRALFCLRPSERCLAASAFSPLRARLQTRVEWRC